MTNYLSTDENIELIINTGIQLGVSDIHWESHDHNHLLIRYRIDGELVNKSYNNEYLSPIKILTRIKLLAGMNIDQKRLPQDGRMPWKFQNKNFDMRVASIAGLYGESLTMRILDREDLNLDLSQLGFIEEDLAILKKLLHYQDGLVLVYGPTGSGKTTTLYAALNYRRTFSDKIITVEDPIEYEFDTFSQIPVRSQLGMTFPVALRAILRQAPNTIMIGEIRDKETAQIAINAALTGHLVLSTLHANDSLSVLSRLLDLDIQDLQINSALRGIIGQRLVRRLCNHCKEPYFPSENDLFLLNQDPNNLNDLTLFRPKGCTQCHYTGFNGRIGLFEIFQDNKTLTSLKQSGILKVLAGETTLEETMAAIIYPG